MIEAIAPTDKIRRAYDYASAFYGSVFAPLERKPRMRGLELANIQPTDKVLEVAFGPGATLLEILRQVERSNTVYGVELSPKMLEKTRQHATSAGYNNIDLREANARELPFPDATFDVLYSSYLFDLMPFQEISVILHEFRRVLTPGGRLIVVNMSKRDDSHLSWFERLYTITPPNLVPYLFGGCRPVLLQDAVKKAGFVAIRREFIRHIMPSEIIVAER